MSVRDCWSVSWLLSWSVIISFKKGGKLYFHAPVEASLVTHKWCGRMRCRLKGLQAAQARDQLEFSLKQNAFVLLQLN